MEILQINGFFTILLFYGCYFSKLLIQKRRGIVTDRMGRGNKPKRTFIIEIILKIVTLTMAAVQFTSIYINIKWVLLINNLTARHIGIGISLIGIVIFVIAMITMRDSWRAGIDSSQKTIIVKNGIYRFSRNPAFLGFDLFYIGLTISFCNILQLVFLILSVCMLHLQIIEEEKFLPHFFGEEYLKYKKSTGRYFYCFRQWQ